MCLSLHQVFQFSMLFYVQYRYQSDVLNSMLNNSNDNNVLNFLRLGYAMNPSNTKRCICNPAFIIIAQSVTGL